MGPSALVLKMQLSLESEAPKIKHIFHSSNHLFSIKIINGKLTFHETLFQCFASSHDADLDAGVAASKGGNKQSDGQIDR
jgi:hypothetical protein